MTIASKKFLGLHIDQNLKWDRHTQSICKKIASALGEIKRIRHPVPFDVPIPMFLFVIMHKTLHGFTPK